jgi:hypothetical protein
MTGPWWRDPAQHVEMRRIHGSSAKAAMALGDVSTRQAQHWWARMVAAGSVDSSGNATTVVMQVRKAGAQKKVRDPDGDALEASSKITDSHATLISAANPRGTDKRTPEQMLRDKGLEPDDWDYEFEATEWDGLAGDGKVTTLARVKVRAVRRPESFFAFDIPAGWSPTAATPPAREHGQPILVPILSDPHAPNCQTELIEAFIAWCEAFRPEAVWCLGDAANNSPFGRHGINRRPELNVSVKTAVWSTTELLCRIAAATPGAERMLLFGNHDYWLEKRVLEMFPKLAEIVRYQEDGPYLTIAKVLKLDDIGWGYHYAAGEYHDVTVEIAQGLVGMHGTRTGQHGGALKELTKWEGVSIIQGHDHTLGMTAVRFRRPGGEHRQRYGISAGSAANADLGYDPAHNVGQGFPVLAIWPDGKWHVDFALYDPEDGSTTWRDFRHDAR